MFLQTQAAQAVRAQDLFLRIQYFKAKYKQNIERFYSKIQKITGVKKKPI